MSSATGLRQTSTAVESIAIEASPAQATAAVALLSVVADPVRHRIVSRLAAEGTRCVCNLQGDPDVAGNLLSYHLKVLRDNGLVTAARRGRWVDYTLSPDALARLHDALPASRP